MTLILKEEKEELYTLFLFSFFYRWNSHIARECEAKEQPHARLKIAMMYKRMWPYCALYVPSGPYSQINYQKKKMTNGIK